jgi:DnaK suppressor protein
MAGYAYETHRQALLRKRAQILKALHLERGEATSDERVAEEDQGSIAHEEFVTMRLNRLDCAQLRMIDEALDRIESGDYGVCLSCEESIPDKRLMALPWARYCVPCQEHINVEPLFEQRPFRLAS